MELWKIMVAMLLEQLFQTFNVSHNGDLLSISHIAIVYSPLQNRFIKGIIWIVFLTMIFL